jgi:hypothetical protein
MSRIVALLIVAPILLVVGAIVTGLAFVFDGLSQYNDPFSTAAQYGVGFVIAASAAIALLVVSRRGKHRAGVVVGAVLTGVAVLVSGAPLALSVGGLVRTGIQSLQPLTAEEQTSMAELRDKSDTFFGESTSTLGELERFADQTSTYGCLLGNLDEGTQLADFVVYSVPVASKGEAIHAIATQWESLGYDVSRSDDYLTMTGQGWIESARVSWRNDPGADVGNLAIDVTSICVVET